ncbi:hypothetical protein, partial [Bradyrhizobium sp. RT10b]|uniref:hypothetical protein n=1 Tax=Bradyrhizobium sp. RT10b TaxID=3156331 RepID=UPI0033909CCF
MFKLRHKPISNQRSIIPRSTPSMEGGTETALTNKQNADEIMHMARFDPNVAAPAGAGCKEPERAAVQH